MAARAGVDEGPDPDRVPEHDLLRQRRLRRRAGLPRSTSATRATGPRQPGRGGAARRDPRGPDASTTRSPTRRSRARAGTSCCSQMLAAALPRRRTSTAAAARAPMPEPAGRPALRRRQGAGGAVLRELRDRPARSTEYGTKRSSAAACSVTTTIDLGLQKIAREAIAKVLPPSIGPTAALVAIDAHTGAVLAMVGGRNYHAEPVQPRDAGRAPARLGVQAVRARGGAAGRGSRRRRRSSRIR